MPPTTRFAFHTPCQWLAISSVSAKAIASGWVRGREGRREAERLYLMRERPPWPPPSSPPLSIPTPLYLLLLYLFQLYILPPYLLPLLFPLASSHCHCWESLERDQAGNWTTQISSAIPIRIPQFELESLCCNYLSKFSRAQLQLELPLTVKMGVARWCCQLRLQKLQCCQHEVCVSPPPPAAHLSANLLGLSWVFFWNFVYSNRFFRFHLC